MYGVSAVFTAITVAVLFPFLVVFEVAMTIYDTFAGGDDDD
jgi:hypothetical protein